MDNLADIAVVWAIGLLAVLVSINARGTVRITFSWVITVAVLGICIFASTMKISTLKRQLFDGAIADSMPSDTVPPATMPVQTTPALSASQTQAPVPSLDDQAKEYLKAAQRIVGSALGCAGAITAFETTGLGDLPDSRYEQEQSRALSLRNQASSISRQVKTLVVPASMAYIQADLEKSAESLRLAGWAVHSFFSAENDQEEANFEDQFRRYSQNAQIDLKSIQQELLRQR